ncbi:MAG: hypothetical protein WEB13_03025 [Dehalococcoidia bacterium]
MAQLDDDIRRRAKVDADRRHHTRLASTLAVYLYETGEYAMRQDAPGSGAGVPEGRLRICIEVDAARFWRTYSRLAERKRRRGGDR